MASFGRVLATGFNLHGQLKPGVLGTCDNLHHFTQIQTVDHAASRGGTVIVCALWSATINNTGSRFIHHGISGSAPGEIHFDELIGLDGRPKRGVFFGDISGVEGFLDEEAGELYILQEGGNHNARFARHSFQPDDFLPRMGKSITAIAIAGNLQVCIALSSKDPGVAVFSNLYSFLRGSDPVEQFPADETVKSLVASSTTFTTLGQRRGRVKTFGDARYPSLLGRSPSPQSPASLPTVISALDGIDIAKIVAGSSLVAAVSRQKDLYVWGHVMQQPFEDSCSSFKGLLDTMSADGTPEDVHLIDIADGQDVEDVAVGNEHLVVLTTNGQQLWGYGSNENGQLGLGRNVKNTLGKWVKIHSAEAGEKIQEIATGPLSSFIMVGRHAPGE
ncbi:MAG: hypothetical protein Q9168_001195 [Polycauliona sp. 1 TL-2023]